MPTDLSRNKEKELDSADQLTFFEATISVLGYREDGEWVALALEMDLRGYGDTWEAALEDLRDCVLMQISFAQFKGELEMIWKNAEDKYWEFFREAQRIRIQEALTEVAPHSQAEFHAGGLSIPPAHVIAAQSGRFLPANG